MRRSGHHAYFQPPNCQSSVLFGPRLREGPFQSWRRHYRSDCVQGQENYIRYRRNMLLRIELRLQILSGTCVIVRGLRSSS
jgi:hypothetical protein